MPRSQKPVHHIAADKTSRTGYENSQQKPPQKSSVSGSQIASRKDFFIDYRKTSGAARCAFLLIQSGYRARHSEASNSWRPRHRNRASLAADRAMARVVRSDHEPQSSLPATLQLPDSTRLQLGTQRQ